MVCGRHRRRFPKFISKGTVERDGYMCTDVLQVWLDLSWHRTRGQERSDLIYRRYLYFLVESGFIRPSSRWHLVVDRSQFSR